MILDMIELRKRDYRPDSKAYTTTDQVVRAANTLKYIDKLADSAGVPILNVPLVIFHNSEGKIITDRTKINKIFFEWVNETPEAKTPKRKEISDHIRAELNSALNQMTDRERNSLLDLRDRLKRDVENYGRMLGEKQRSFARVMRDLNGLTVENKDFTLEIEQILASGFYVDVKVANGSAAFITKEIILSHVLPSAGVDHAFNLGSFEVSIRMYGPGGPLRVFVNPHNNNTILHNGGYYHPHVYNDGVLCLGSLETKTQKAIADRNLPLIFECAEAALTNYNYDSVYRPLQDFISQATGVEYDPREDYFEDSEESEEEEEYYDED